MTTDTKAGPGKTRGCLTLAGMIALFLCGLCGCVGLNRVPNLLVGVDSLSDRDMREGRPCTATVLSVKDTGNRLNHKQVFEFQLRVKPDEGPTDGSYEVTIRDAPNAIDAGRVKTDGTEFRCVIDRNDESRVKVFWGDET